MLMMPAGSDDLIEALHLIELFGKTAEAVAYSHIVMWDMLPAIMNHSPYIDHLDVDKILGAILRLEEENSCVRDALVVILKERESFN